jgi:hypothetical protein
MRANARCVPGSENIRIAQPTALIGRKAGVKSMEPHHGSDVGTGGLGTERIAAFSDGVIAIIITTMVLDLKLPKAAAKGEASPGFPSLSRRSVRSTP